jgi:hypothetical protein
MDDDASFPDLAEAAGNEPSARGILQCLRLLADEAATLHLGRTVAALRTAMLVCADEGGTEDDAAAEDHDAAVTTERPPPLLH